jgi:hypothetical protein
MTAMRKIIKEVEKVIVQYFSSNDQLLSSEIKEILDNPIDRQEYFKAIDELKKSETPDKEVTLTLSNKKNITLILNH